MAAALAAFFTSNFSKSELAIMVSCGLATDAELLQDIGQHSAWKPKATASLCFFDRFPE